MLARRLVGVSGGFVASPSPLLMKDERFRFGRGVLVDSPESAIVRSKDIPEIQSHKGSRRGFWYVSNGEGSHS